MSTDRPIRCPVQCIIPPYITERLAQSANPAIRRRAMANLSLAASFRATRIAAQSFPSLMASRSPAGTLHRLIYDAQGGDQLPGVLLRSEGEAESGDPAANEAYDHSGKTYNYFREIFGRNSLDGNGMTLISSVHVGEPGGEPMNNAFWNGEQMAYGDGDGVLFQRFIRSLDVVSHELTHGVESFTSNLEYQGESGALNEHFADVFGVLVRQWVASEVSEQANWVIGADVLVPTPTRRGIRDMENPGTAYVNDPELGTDPQPAHMNDVYRGSADRGGVHINSGIPNRAFVLAVKTLGRTGREVIGRVWYQTLLELTGTSGFADCARVSISNARDESPEAEQAVRSAWAAVGV
jgi:Zn-dependent metalloprotease